MTHYSNNIFSGSFSDYNPEFLDSKDFFFIDKNLEFASPNNGKENQQPSLEIKRVDKKSKNK